MKLSIIKRVLISLFSILIAITLIACSGSSNPIHSDTTNSDPTDTASPPECEHLWKEANCSNPKICFKCNKTEGEKNVEAHAYVEKGEQLLCIYCGVPAPIREVDCEHVAGADTCPLCGETELNVIKNVIYIIGDGMGLEHIAAGEIAFGKDYCFDDWQFATVNTDSLSAAGKGYSAVTDSAAAGTALATGVVTYNQYVGRDANKNDLTTILDHAKSLGKRTGIISTDALFGATPGAFSAHCDSRGDYPGILQSQIQSGIDLLCGNKDSNIYLNDTVITQNGYVHCKTSGQMRKNSDADKLYCTLNIFGYKTSYGHVTPSQVTPIALDYLDNETGFVLMIEQSHIDAYAHTNSIDDVLKSVDELNNTVEAIFEWMGDRTDTAIIITADHETGDLSVSKTNTLPNSTSINNGPTLYYLFNSTGHTNSTVGLFIYGADVDIEQHSYYNNPYNVKNTDIYTIVYRLLHNLR